MFLDQISFETKQKSKYKVDFNFIFISIEKIFWKYPNFFGENPGTNQNFIAHVHTFIMKLHNNFVKTNKKKILSL